MRLRRRRAGLGLGPGVILGDAVRLDALRRVAGMEVRLEPPRSRLRQILDDEAAGAPFAAAGGHDFADSETHQGRDLLRALEIMMRRGFQPLTLERDHALIAIHLAARIDSEGHVTVAEKVVARARSALEPRPVEPRERAQMRRRVEIDQKHGDRAVALGLQLEPAVHLQGRSEQGGERHRFRHQLRHRFWIVVALEELVDRRPEPHQSAPRTQGFDGERQHDVVDDLGRGGALEHRHGSTPRHQASTPFCACRRFSASSKTTDCGPSITSSVTSSPRWAGRQCMKIASVAAWLINS